MDVQEIGEKIRTLREERHMTQQELADQLYVTNKAISKWERGVNYPDISRIEGLAAALGTTEAELLGLKGKSEGEVISAMTYLSDVEQRKIVRESYWRGWLTIVFGSILLAACLHSGYVMDQVGLSALSQGNMAGMCGFVGTLIGNGIWQVHNTRRLLKGLQEKLIRPRRKTAG